MSTECRVCGKILKRQPYVTLGIGPVCLRNEALEEGLDEGEDIVVPYDGKSMWIERTDEGVIITNVPHVNHYHSESFEFGYAGSGPADFALNCLLLYGLSEDAAFALHQDFKWQFIARCQENKLVIKKSEIKKWLKI